MTNEKSSIVSIFGSNVKTCRKRLKMTQEQLAEKSGITVKYVSNIECAISFPSSSVIAAVAKALDIPEYKLFVPEDIKQENYDDSFISKAVLKREIDKHVKSLLNELN